MNEKQKGINKRTNLPNDINIIPPLSSVESRKVLYFQKINSLNDINTFGSQPVIVYKKQPKNKTQNAKSPIPFNQTIQRKTKNDLGKKLQKFNSFSSMQYHNKNIKIKKTKSYTENIVLIEKNNKIKEENQRKKNIKDQQLFSKTVRESNMRPVFPKNKNRQFNSTNNEFNKKKSNIKENEKGKENINKEINDKKIYNNEQDIKKNMLIKQLIENAVTMELKKYQNIENNKIKSNKKREYLEENGFTTISNEETTEKENKDNSDSFNENNQEKGKKESTNKLIPKNNNYIFPEDIIHKNLPPKSKKKPSIEQFEYLQKIKEEQKKLNLVPKKINYNNYINANSFSNIAPSFHNYPQKTVHSFRKKNKRIYEENNKITNDEDENSYSLEDKRNHRSTREINEYLREKKIKLKQNEENKQLEKNKKLFLKFKNLYNLNMNKDVYSINKQQNNCINMNKPRIIKNNHISNNKIEERKDKDDIINVRKNLEVHPILNNSNNFYSNISNNKINNENNCLNIRKKKEINEFYIGNDSTLRNNSTFIDVNEYYLNILESQQLLVNSKLKKIINETETNPKIPIEENKEEYNNDNLGNNEKNINTDINEKINDNLILNDLCVSKEQIKKIIEKEKTKSSNSKKSDEILSTNSIEELKQKINTTLKKANLFFSKEVMDNYKQKVLNNITNTSEKNNVDTSIKSYNNKSTNNNEESKEKEKNEENLEILSNKEKDSEILEKKIEIEEKKIEKEEKKIEKEEKIKKVNKNEKEEIKINNYLNEEDTNQKSSEIKIETSNINNNNNIKINNKNDSNSNTNSENDGLKEKNLTTLSHNYTTSTNPNIQVKITIEPRSVLNLVEIIKFIIQRKIFVILYESYIKHAISQQYNIAFSFFVAICKQYPFKKLEEFYNYKTYNYAFRQLFRPFNRKNFKYFVSRFHFKKKVEYLVSLLTKMIKFKTIERIYIYGQYFQEDDEEKAFKMIISKIIYTLIKPHLCEAFNIFKSNLYQKNENKLDKDDSEVNFNISDEDENLSINNNYVNFNSENKEKNLENEKILNSNSKLNEKNNENNIGSKNNENNIENSDLKDNINDIEENIINNNNGNNDNNIIENNSINEINHSDDSIKNHRRKNDSSLKMNSFLYESVDSDDKSSISVEPNSLDNDKLHQLKILLIAKNKNFENDIDDNYINDEIDFEINNSSKKSEKSLKELMNIKSIKNTNKTLSDMMEENSLQKLSSQNSIDDLKKTLNNQIFNNSKNTEKIIENNNDGNNINIKNNSYSNSSLNSIASKEKNNKTEEIKMNNEAKDTTKEITEDSNTININTNNKSDMKSSDIKTNEINSENKINDNIKINEVNNEKENNINNNNKEEKKENQDNDEEIEKKIIDVEYNIPRNNLKSKLLKNYKIIEKNDEENLEINDIKEENMNNENDKIIKNENRKIKIPLIKIINESNDSENKNSKEESKESKDSKESKEIKVENKLTQIFENKEQFADKLVTEIINKLIFSEIKNSKLKLLPNKKYKFEKFLKKSLINNNSSQSQNSLNNSCNSAGNIGNSHKSSSHSLSSLHEDVFSLNDSLNSNYSVYSVFNKTIKDKKKEHSLHLYFNKICPYLISYLHSEIIKKYPRIYSNISLEKKNISEKLMISLVLQDAQMLRSNYKKINYKENIDKIIDKKEILRNFSFINKKIRQEDNITSDNYYDNMINECVLETAIELIEKERFYGDSGEPLKWSLRTREISFKYGINDAKKFADNICKKILKIIHNRIGLINDNYSYMSQDEINYEREKRLLDTIKKDLNRNEAQWKNLEMEETQLKVESTEMILDQLYNEVIEILEHIQYNRASPELYQFKSIYACEEIPKLSFQQTTTEDMKIPEGEENDFMNI